VRADAAGVPLPYTLTDTLMVASDSQEQLQWLLAKLGEGAGSPFAAAITERYKRGAGWLLAMDVEQVAAAIPDADEASSLLGAGQMKHLFVEQRSPQGGEENEVTLTFKGPRMGMASWLAGTGSTGAAEYLPADAILAAYVSTREPRQLFDELTAQLTPSNPSLTSDLAEAESQLGINFATDVAAALGTESAFAVEGFSVSGPVWVLAAVVNDPEKLDNSIRRLVEVHNGSLATDQQDKMVSLAQETVDGHAWTTLKPKASLFSVTWTYDQGYLVAANDRGTAMRAIATRNGGSPLVWSDDFRRQLPSSSALSPSAFAWLNTKGALQGFEGFVTNPTIKTLLAERDPILVVFSGSTEQIRAASRTRITGMLTDVMLLESLTRIGTGAPPKDTQ